MAKQPTITTINSGFYSTAALNNNFEAIKEKFDNTVSRDGSSPNNMEADLDMNSNDILNANRVYGSDFYLRGLRLTPTTITADVVSFLEFGAVADGSTDNATAFTNALSYLSSKGGGTLYVPAALSAYVIKMPSNPAFTIPANITIEGDGENSILSVEAGTASTGTVFNLSGDNAVFRNIRIDFDISDSTAFSCGADNLLFDRCYLNGGHTAINTTTFHCFVFSGASFEGLTVRDSEIKNFRYGILKSNTNTGTHTKIRILNNVWENNYANHIAFNSPSGIISDVLVQGNRFLDCPGGDAFGTFAIMCGMANAGDYRVIGNHFEGVCKDAIHLEEGNGRIIIQGNTANSLNKGANTNGGRFIFAVDNDVGTPLTYVDSKKVVISDNVAVGSSTSTAQKGLYVVITPSSSTRGLDRFSVVNNNFSLFETGYFFEDLARNAAVSLNTAESCTTGFKVLNDSIGAMISDNRAVSCTTAFDLANPWPDIRGNTVLDCTTGFASTGAGMIGPAKFNGVTDPVTSSSSVMPVLLKWTVEDEDLVIAATPSTTNLSLFPFPTRCNGRLYLSFFQEGTTTRVDRYWDIDITTGGVVTATLVYQRSFGSVLTSGPPFDDSGNLTVTFTNSSSEKSNGVLQVVFEGMYEI